MDQARTSLNSLDSTVRRTALERLVHSVEQGHLRWPEPDPKVNLHCHTIYSYNGYGYSPSFLAWLAREQGWYALGTVDFDVLDGVDETLWACRQVGLRGAAGLETRVHVPDRSDVTFNSPGEPGVMYYVGMGFVSSTPAADARDVLEDMHTRAQQRNREMVARLNAYLDPVRISYDDDVLPLTPSGNATERHILVAYDAAARQQFPERGMLLAYWAQKLDLSIDQVETFLGDEPFPHDPIRARLMKQGGVGYMRPGPGTFPPLQNVISAIIACGALPCYAFLDGRSEGESDMPALLGDMLERGTVGMTVIPDRNWNVDDPERRALLVNKLHKTLDLARDLRIPVFAGTEMNKAGQPLIDDFDAAPLAPYVTDFMRGANLIHAHTALQQTHRLGYLSTWAQEFLPKRTDRFDFYVKIGQRLSPSDNALARIDPEVVARGPEALLQAL